MLRVDFQSSTALFLSFFFPFSLPTLADLHPPSNTLVRFSTLSQMFYSRFYNALPIPIAHSVTIDQGSLCRVPCVVHILCTITRYTLLIDFSVSLSPCVSHSQHVLQSQLSSRHLCARRHDHTLRPALVQKYTFAS